MLVRCRYWANSSPVRRIAVRLLVSAQVLLMVCTAAGGVARRRRRHDHPRRKYVHEPGTNFVRKVQNFTDAMRIKNRAVILT